MKRRKVLFLCSGNSARSQMAEALVRNLAGDNFDAFSAGTQPTEVHPQTVAVLKKFGITKKSIRSKHVSEFRDSDFDYVISLCDKARLECKDYPTSGKRMDWNFEDPASRSGPNPFETTLNEISGRISMFVLIETKKRLPKLVLDPTQFFKSLTDEVRLRCLMLIQYEGELCVCEMMQALNDIQPKVSRHLALLRKSGLLVDRRQGQWMYYRINPNLPAWAKSVLAETTENNAEFIANSIRNLNAMSERPNRALQHCP
jgi:ArsR family transcriptional regulator, arsenate/arsenite/antimonite-responsive transcriptional repressor / arsenate reductase (thioredoxin)